MAVCPHCGKTNRDIARFCAYCGGTLAPAVSPVESGQICPNCNRGNSPTARFCKACGQPLVAPPDQTPPATPPFISSPPPPPASAITGQLSANSYLAKRYLIVRRIGQGGMGAVYEGVDIQRENQRCAVKEMSSTSLPTIAERQLAVANFEREVKMLSTLDHPNLPRVMDYFSEGGRHYMVMEFIEGQTLADRIEETGLPVPEPEVQTVAEQLCVVLDYLHSQSPPIVFRDLKPGNIMVQPDGQVKLIDFGIVRFFDASKKQDTQLLGTPGFAAPEAYGGQTDARSDIFSLGMTLYCLLTAKAPPQNLAYFQPTIDLSTCSSNLPQVIEKAVRIKRNERWATTGELIQVLRGEESPRKEGDIGVEVVFGRISETGQHPGPSAGGIRGATQRLTQKISLRVRQMSNAQLTGIVIVLIAGIGLLTWLVGPWIARNLPWLWEFLPIYFAAGPFAYAVSNRKGSAALVHVPLQLIVTALTWSSFNFGLQLLAGLVAATGMEGMLYFSANRKNRWWYYAAAPALGITLSMGLLMLTGYGFFNTKEVLGAGVAGIIAYIAGEVVWGVREGV